MASLADSLALLGQGRAACSVANLRDSLEPEDRFALELALDNSRIASTTLSAALRANGHLTSEKAIQRHRARTCVCASDPAAA